MDKAPTLKFLKILTVDVVSRTAYSSVAAQTKSRAGPKLLLRKLSAVCTMYSPSPHTTTKRPLGLWASVCG